MDKININDLRENYFKLLKKVSEKELQDLIAILHCEPDFICCNKEFENLNKQEKDLCIGRWHTLTMFEKQAYERLKKLLREDFGIFEKEVESEFRGMKLYTYPKVPLLISTIQEQLDLIATGQVIPKDKRITLIECFTSKFSDNDYSIVINGDYLRPLEVSKTTKTWRRFFDLLDNGGLGICDENRDLYDYLNSNDKNLIFKNTEYPRQTLIKIKSGRFIPNFKYKLATSKMLKQRQGKQKKST